MKGTNLSVFTISLGRKRAEKVISVPLKKLVQPYDVTLIFMFSFIHFPIPEGVNTIILRPEEVRTRSSILKIFDSIFFVREYHRVIKKKKISYAISFLALPNLINEIISKIKPTVKSYIIERGYTTYNTASKLSIYISRIFFPLLYNKYDKLFSNPKYINENLNKTQLRNQKFYEGYIYSD